MNQFIIRQYIPTDTDQIKILNIKAIQAITIPYSGENLHKDLDDIENGYIKNKGEFLVGVIENQIIAMGALSRVSENIAELKRMRVDPDFQRNGFGQKMLVSLEKRAKELGYNTIQLDTTIKLIGAQKLYEKNGYIEVRRETMGWPEETIFYQKNI